MKWSMPRWLRRTAPRRTVAALDDGRTVDLSEILAIAASAATQQTPAAPTPRAVTGAVARVTMTGASWRSYRFGDRAWQADAWRLYDITGQLRFVANWIGNSVSRCRMYVAEIGDDGELLGEVTDPEIAALANGPLGTGDSKAEALRLLGIDLYVPGEAYIVAEAGGAEDGSDLWWVVTSRQIKRVGDTITVMRSPNYGGGLFTYREGVDLILRCWTPHPADTYEPDSPARSAIPDLREIEALRKRSFAELDSRLSGAGILAIPENMELPRGDDDPIGSNGFSALLMRTMATSLKDRSSADAMVPIIVTGAADDVKEIRHITFWSELSAQIGEMRTQAIGSLAQSLDIPPEVLLGLGGTNHWAAWAISDEAVTTQIKPILSRIAAAFTVGYLGPAVEQRGKDPSRFIYQFDTAPLTTRPNRTADALQLHDRFLISDDAARDAGAWGPGDAPTPEELAFRMALKMVQRYPAAGLGDSGVRELLGLPDKEAAPADTSPDGPETAPGTPPAKDTNAPPEQPAESDGPPAAHSVQGAEVAAKIAARRILGLAGTRLVPHNRRQPATPKHLLHLTHGPVAAGKLDALLAGAWEDFGALTTEDLGMDELVFRHMVEDHCRYLLSRGIGLDDDLLVELITYPRQRQAVSCG